MAVMLIVGLLRQYQDKPARRLNWMSLVSHGHVRDHTIAKHRRQTLTNHPCAGTETASRRNGM